MNVPTITMDPEAAGERADEYEDKGTTEEDAAIARGFRELEDGHKLISLRSVFSDVARDARQRPRLAIARADRTQVKYFGNGLRDCFHSDWKWHRGRGIRDGEIIVEQPSGTHIGPLDGYALVPIVPPAIRTRRDLTRYFILWEVEQWADSEITALADRDPFLLKRVDDDLFAIVAEWDLTPLEQTVLARRIFR